MHVGFNAMRRRINTNMYSPKLISDANTRDSFEKMPAGILIVMWKEKT